MFVTNQSATALCGDQLARGRGVAGVVTPTDAGGASHPLEGDMELTCRVLVEPGSAQVGAGHPWSARDSVRLIPPPRCRSVSSLHR